MKRTGYLFNKIVAIDNIKEAAKKASKGKRNQRRVQSVLNNLDYYAKEISMMLINKTYTPSSYVVQTMKDGPRKKVREISKPRFYPDQIIHWALMLAIQPVLENSMYYYSCGSIPGKGTTFGQKAVKKWIKDKKNTKYCLKLDVKKFYPSIDNEVLKQKFRKKIKDQDTLWLIDSIIDTADGLPIGNYTSQWFANFYLTDTDHFIKRNKSIKYIRYVDDLVIFGPNKKKLHKLKKELEEHFSELKLSIKKDWQVFKTDSRPIDFLGLKFYRTHTTLRRRNSLRIKKRAKRIEKKGYLSVQDARAIISYWGWIKRTNSYNYYTRHVKPYVSINQCRKVVSRYAKQRNRICSNS